MSPSAPETCSASDDFEKNSLGRYGIQPYQFEPRVETVTFVEALEQWEALWKKTRIWKSRRKSETHAAKFRLVGNEVVYLSG